MPRTIKLAELADNYRKGVAAKSDKWYNHASTASGVIAAGSSDAAEKNYNDHMTIALSNKLRQKGLQKVTDADYQAGVRAAGASGYSQGAQKKADKLVKKFTPYAATIDSTVAGLAARTADAATNVLNRVSPIAVALQRQKRGT
jgi:major membrane immunogen (membrane-anchored lipoprotein)